MIEQKNPDNDLFPCRICGSWAHMGSEHQKYAIPSKDRLPFAALKEQIQADHAYAWGWHCNIAMSFFDAGGDADTANEGAARFMQMAFDVDVRKFPEWASRRRSDPNDRPVPETATRTDHRMPKSFPVLGADAFGSDCPRRINWYALNEEWAHRNHSQSLDTLARRGGLAPAEIVANGLI